VNAGRSTPTVRRVSGPTVLLLFLATPLWNATAFAAEPEEIRGPDVTIIAEEERTVFEFRQGGVLRMIRVVPSWGKPYYLIPRDQTKGHEDLERAETLQPSWVILEF
jgi:hypothetical protein